MDHLENPGFIDDLRCADVSKYHPHDLLILKYFPDTDVTSTPRHRSTYNLALTYEECGIAPPRVPWPLPPPRPREQLQVGVEEWRGAALSAIDARVALYAHDPTPSDAVQPSTSAEASSCHIFGRTHRTLCITELLEHILRRLQPSEQFNAWNVSVAWRDMVAYILKSQYRSHHPCSPVEYGQIIDENLQWLQPSGSELAQLEEEVTSLSRETVAEHSFFFYTARLTQARELSDATFNAIRTATNNRFLSSNPDFPSRADGPQWLDLSQFVFNPYFLDLFSDHLQLNLGRCEIIVQPKLRNFLIPESSLADPVLGELIRSMFLTQPPCKALGVYIPSMGLGGLQLVTRVYNTDGVRVGHLLSELQRHLANAIDMWRRRAQELRQRMAESDWTDYSLASKRRGLWHVPGFPKLVIFLESAKNPITTLAEHMYFISEDYTKLCEYEWYQDVGELHRHTAADPLEHEASGTKSIWRSS